ncbi:MAG: hypothetical protein A3J30_00325 [Candidatus Wildermuthbacteria bacterium RIFCSPLOWO2_02_FULL_47_9c]|uniref:Queuine tRNA-ribosyltransferase n=1 Tax=Candidatus Wildermuthbacteria bacterium RIFCSPLOWO2_02_FULL_47_9c TaxID=1802466 RepID=A0A1G2RVL8_9BACT|nr:MAG: Queuine tRNA-ribosyltransferase [Parcubacteria group bacterium GW2011_GWA2_50_10]OHA61487.1 MAG: hypothetical protein A2109_01240 [Candidatus Wildermuthbacteria bacterium GWA1_49_26]OHA66170.1 MAG: hypothetical protein A2674_01795 [Candidatus Wildermuthbacteria bacterium RIFCSPHIGHO2_01_FULL_50_47]OHA69770.1 MAG: hypothetical protein A3D63_00815 [Candidatus Wildermuthbacteria bacterium RIFCSPHIGHO2_02_FULL_49_17]OHA71639.1 MAG: hypothetical protein A3E08_01425 [Candidatus Wildermuthbact
MTFFQIERRSKKTRARLGKITTPRGEILTPAFVPVATKGTLKAIPPKDIKELGVQVAFVNTFHLVDDPGLEVIEKFGGIHKYAKLDIPLMSDSGGFQVFSLGGKKIGVPRSEEKGTPVLEIDEQGVCFRSPKNGEEVLFTPEFSIQAQKDIGADIIMAFDECIFYGADKKYTEKATERTHRWLLRCIKAKKRKDQTLYGIIQGGVFKDLRIDSAKFVAKQNIDGIAIGGVSVGETHKELRDQVKWVALYLPEHLPCHLLGVGRIEDITEFIKLGIDTFDCAEPTRIARHGQVFRRQGQKIMRLDAMKGSLRGDKNPIDKNCVCYTCQNFSLSFLHHLFQERELIAYYLASYHNLFFFEQIFRELRRQIATGKI